MARRNNLGQFEISVLLAVMRFGGGAYCVPLSRAIEDSTHCDGALGSVYFALERLETKGLLSSELGEPTAERGGRAKRYFRVTATGVREVRNARRALTKLWEGLPQLESNKA